MQIHFKKPILDSSFRTLVAVITWREAGYVCVPLLSILTESKYDEEKATLEAHSFLSEHKISAPKARECIDAYVKNMIEGISYLDTINKGESRSHNRVVDEERCKINWLRNLGIGLS
jgi:hypothetical protein